MNVIKTEENCLNINNSLIAKNKYDVTKLSDGVRLSNGVTYFNLKSTETEVDGSVLNTDDLFNFFLLQGFSIGGGSATDGAVESVTGDLVDNTNPSNPKVNMPVLDEGDFLVGGSSGNEQRRILPTDIGLTENNTVAVRNSNGNLHGLAMSSSAANSTIPLRTPSGQGKFTPATSPDEAVVLSQLNSSLENKVDKEAGKVLSEENFTTDEKTKLSGLESPKFKGQFLSISDLNSADVGEVGGYAYVDGGAGGTVDLYIWDAVNSLWEIVAGESTAETPASIKSKYESNPDTNVLTDTEKQALNSLLTDNRFSLKRLGTWNASSNTPELLQGVGTRGDYYVVTTSGSYDFGNGLIRFNQGDWVIFTGGIWHKLVTTDNTVNWDDVQNKPNIPAPTRGNISTAIPALRKGLNSAQSIPASTNTRISTWGTGYDQFSLEDTNGIFIMPDWASHARVTCSAILDYLQVGRFFHLELRLNTTSTSNSLCTGAGTSRKPTVFIDTGIIPVIPGDEFSAVVWHNADTAKPLESGARTMINIELFETI